MKKLVIFGAENFAEISHYYLTHDSEYAVVAFTVDGAYMRENSFRGLPVVPFEDVVRHFPPSDHDMLVAVGIRELNSFRARKVAEAEAKGYALASYLSSRARTAQDLVLAPNTMIMEDVTVQPFATIGRNTIVWPACRIAMYDRIGDHCWLVTISTGESVTIGDYSFVGLASVLAPYVSVGRNNLIGAGSLILNSTKDFAVYRGAGSKPSRVPSNRAARLLE